MRAGPEAQARKKGWDTIAAAVADRIEPYIRPDDSRATQTQRMKQAHRRDCRQENRGRNHQIRTREVHGNGTGRDREASRKAGAHWRAHAGGEPDHVDETYPVAR